MRSITIDTVQGIGDIIWVYRKLAPLYDKINVNVLIVSYNSMQKRSRQLLECLPKVEKIKYKLVSKNIYNRVASTLYELPNQNGEYSVNAWLESGIHIDKVNNCETCWDLGIEYKPFEKYGNNEYLLLYISGNNSTVPFYQLETSEWVKLAVTACRKMKLKKCVLIGSEIDRPKLDEVKNLLRHHVKTEVITDYEITATIGVIKKAKYFIAYQSGLCMLSEEVGTPIFMVYYTENAHLVTSWIREENLYKGLIQSTFFSMHMKSKLNAMNNHIEKVMK